MLGSKCSKCCVACPQMPERVTVTLTGGGATPMYRAGVGRNFYYAASRSVLVDHDFAGDYELVRLGTSSPIEACTGYELGVFSYSDSKVSLTFGFYADGQHPCRLINWWLGMNVIRWRIIERYNLQNVWWEAEIPPTMPQEELASDGWKSGLDNGLWGAIQVNQYPERWRGSGGAWASNELRPDLAEFLESSNIVPSPSMNHIFTSYVTNGFVDDDSWYRQLLAMQSCPAVFPGGTGLHTSTLNLDLPAFASSEMRYAGDFGYDTLLYGIGGFGNLEGQLQKEQMRQGIQYQFSIPMPQTFDGAAPQSPPETLDVSGELRYSIELSFPDDSGVDPVTLPYE